MSFLPPPPNPNKQNTEAPQLARKPWPPRAAPTSDLKLLYARSCVLAPLVLLADLCLLLGGEVVDDVERFADLFRGLSLRVWRVIYTHDERRDRTHAKTAAGQSRRRGEGQGGGRNVSEWSTHRKFAQEQRHLTYISTHVLRIRNT